MDLEKLLATSNPDKHYEYFWMTFKTLIYKIVPADLQAIIDIYSSKLNALQKQKNYLEIVITISEFMTNNIVPIIAHGFVHDSYNVLRLIRINVRRWMAIDTSFSEDFLQNTIEYTLLLPVSNYINKSDPRIDNVCDYIKDYFKHCIKFEKYTSGCLTKEQSEILFFKLTCIVNSSIEAKTSSVLDGLCKFIDMTLFYKDDVDKKRYRKVLGAKLLNFAEPKTFVRPDIV